MTKKILVSALTLLSSLSLPACDICGCGAGNNYIGILPDFSTQIVGIRYRYNHMLTHLGVGGTTTYLTTRESYHTAEAWGGWNITKNIRVMASVPYAFNERQNQGRTSRKNGIGDVTFIGFYQLVNNRSTVQRNKLLVQGLWLGGGIKLATGTYNPADKTGTGGENANLFQLGTGSYDFQATAMYDLRLQDAGLNLVSTYRINTANRQAYRYGNKFSLAGQLYYKIKTGKKANVAPNIGLQSETAGNDTDDHIRVTASGGNILLGTAGLETVFHHLSVGANYQYPLSQQLANGIVKAQSRMMVHIAVVL